MMGEGRPIAKPPSPGRPDAVAEHWTQIWSGAYQTGRCSRVWRSTERVASEALGSDVNPLATQKPPASIDLLRKG